MKIYQLTYSGGFGGGLALVAANSQEEALNVFANDGSYYLDKREVESETVDNIFTTEEKPCVLVENFYLE